MSLSLYNTSVYNIISQSDTKLDDKQKKTSFAPFQFFVKKEKRLYQYITSIFAMILASGKI